MSSLHRYDNSDALSPVQLWWLFSFILQLVEAQTWDIEKWKIQLNDVSETIFFIYLFLFVFFSCSRYLSLEWIWRGDSVFYY